MKYIGWLAALALPVAVIAAQQYLPYPGSLLISLGAVGAFIGLILYEQARHRDGINRRTIIEQVFTGILLLALLSTGLLV